MARADASARKRPTLTGRPPRQHSTYARARLVSGRTPAPAPKEASAGRGIAGGRGGVGEAHGADRPPHGGRAVVPEAAAALLVAGWSEGAIDQERGPAIK